MTPAELGFRQPAEWAPHAAVWTAWPYLVDEWAEGIEAPRQQLAAMCAAIGEPVEMLIRPEDEEGARARLGRAQVRFHHIPYGDVWLRDTGPVFLARPGELAAARFQWDGWGGKYVMPGDREVSAEVARLAGVRAFEHDFVLEGGAIDVDGEGLVLTTRQCLIGGARNPGADQATMERRLAGALGIDRVIWLDRGLLNDHTDGHIDTIARFVAPGVVVCMEPAASDPNRDAMRGILADLRAARLEVMTVPSPGAVFDASATLMPASYMNFYLGNDTVVVPTYGVRADDAALARLEPLFGGRRVVGVRAEAVLVGGGAFHCCTQQQPSLPGGA